METPIPLGPTDRQLLQKLQELWTFADSTLPKLEFKTPIDLRHLLLVSHTGALHRLVRGILAGFKSGSIDALDMLTRSIVEGLINCKYVLEDKTQMRARAYIVHDHKDRLKTVKKLIPLLEQGKAKGMATVTDADRYRKIEETIKQELDDFEKQYGKKNLEWGSLEQRAKASNSEELYTTAFWLLSLDTHLTARGLDRFMKEDNSKVVIELGQDPSRIPLHLRTAYISYMALLNENCNSFGTPPRKDLDKFDFIPT